MKPGKMRIETIFSSRTFTFLSKFEPSNLTWAF